MKKITILLLATVSLVMVSCSSVTDAVDAIKDQTNSFLTANCEIVASGATYRLHCALSDSDNILTIKDNNDNTGDIVLNDSADTMKTGSATAVSGTVTVAGKVWEFRRTGVAAGDTATYKATLD